MTDVSGPVDVLAESFGAFLIPAVVFALGVVGYLLLLLLPRIGLLFGRRR